MKYVIDASIGMKWEIVEVDSDIACLLRDEYRQGIHELLAPDLFPTEVCNSLLMAERRKRIQPGDAILFFADVMLTPPILYDAIPDLLPRALVIASTINSSVYDAMYVALAEREGCELVTADSKLVAKAQPHFPFVKPLSSFP